MRLTFLGTRGNIDLRSREHHRHTATLVSYRGKRVLIDCGDDWLGTLAALSPSEIVITHAHPDHVGGLRRGALCPVYATDDVWEAIRSWGIEEPRRLQHRRPIRIGRLTFEAFSVDHSLCAPAVGYRITAGRASLFYVPDVLAIVDRADALRGITLYIGDGATIVRPLVRTAGPHRIGHASVSTQLDWCAQEGVRRAIFTHCGTPIVRGTIAAEKQISAMAYAKNIDAAVAYDGLQVAVH